MGKAGYYIRSMRPLQWSKNLVVLAALMFSRNLFNPEMALRSLEAFGVFCLLSASIYIFNDVRDYERDRVHPVKSGRPIASGSIPRSGALIFGVLLGLGGLVLASLLGTGFFRAGLVYYFLMIVYSLGLKNAVVLDVLIISIGFVLRAIAGVEVLKAIQPGVLISPWLLVCTLFLALFLGFNKRRHEVTLLSEEAARHRKSLDDYTVEFLDAVIAVVTAATVIAYSIYTIWPATVAKFNTAGLIYTVPFVVYGLFRYMHLVIVKHRGGSPSEILASDVPLVVDIILWLVVAGLVLYTS
ncbi:MAG: decaprenyl-phosphate phosphoribosyltransferase [bacterium]|jgi:4-hydroxybenzoate polyprenyltransferase